MTSKIIDNLYLGDMEDGSRFGFPMIPIQLTIDVSGWDAEKELMNNSFYTIKKVLRILHSAMVYEIPTLVHCHAGMDRSPFMIAAYLHMHKGMSVMDAYDLVCEKHSKTIVHDDWLRQFSRFQK